jgi:prophage regulatory protein
VWLSTPETADCIGFATWKYAKSSVPDKDTQSVNERSFMTDAATTSKSEMQTAALWKLPEVLRNYPVSRASWYSGIREGRYPQPVKLGKRAVAWRSADILALASK